VTTLGILHSFQPPDARHSLITLKVDTVSARPTIYFCTLNKSLGTLRFQVLLIMSRIFFSLQTLKQMYRRLQSVFLNNSYFNIRSFVLPLQAGGLAKEVLHNICKSQYSDELSDP
jgi:hypothetical protein